MRRYQGAGYEFPCDAEVYQQESAVDARRPQGVMKSDECVRPLSEPSDVEDDG